MNRFITLFALIVAIVAVYSIVVLDVLAPKKELTTTRPIEATGQALIGGDFTLVDENGQRRSNSEFNGKYRLVYFGFTSCPDTCPAGLQTISETLGNLEVMAQLVQPLFISVDPERDTPERLKSFLEDYDTRILGMTGTREEVQEVADLFKVYYQKTDMENYFKRQPEVKQTATGGFDPELRVNEEEVATASVGTSGSKSAIHSTEAIMEEKLAAHNHDHPHSHNHNHGDYLVNHSAFFYLLDKEGNYLKHFAPNISADDMTNEIRTFIQ